LSLVGVVQISGVPIETVPPQNRRKRKNETEGEQFKRAIPSRHREQQERFLAKGLGLLRDRDIILPGNEVGQRAAKFVRSQ
jgi:hypothetical protein